jgi:hypothetical protein
MCFGDIYMHDCELQLKYKPGKKSLKILHLFQQVLFLLMDLEA